MKIAVKPVYLQKLVKRDGNIKAWTPVAFQEEHYAYKAHGIHIDGIVLPNPVFDYDTFYPEGTVIRVFITNEYIIREYYKKYNHHDHLFDVAEYVVIDL